jgi:hypothetical protein
MGLLRLHLGLEQLKNRTIKSSTLFQVFLLNHYFRVFIDFQNKTQSFHYMTLSSLSIYVYLWILTEAIVMLCLSLPITKAYVELIGVEKAQKSILAIHIL